MADNNPSVVSDESGKNYGGIGDLAGIQEAQMAYLENLSKLAQRAATGPLQQGQYFPSANQDINVGTVSSKTLGSVPIFATGSGLLPFGMLDEMEKAKYEAEAEFYKKLKSDLDKPLFTEKLQLADPFKQPAFATKVQRTIDSYLDLYTKRFGGDSMKAYIATKNDKNFQKTMRMYKEYTDMFKVVFDQAIQTEADRKTADKYVDPVVIKAVDDFLYSHDNLESLSPDTLLNNAQKFKSIMSADKLAEAATAGYKDSVIESYSKSGSMSTDELDAYIRTKKTNAGAAEDIIKTALESPTYSWLKDNLDQRAIFERGVKNRVKFGEEKALETIKKNNADRDLSLRKMGWMDEKGDVVFQEKPAALVNTMGKAVISYPADVKTIPTTVGMRAYVLQGGKLRLVQLSESYDMKPTSEYDIPTIGAGVIKGRYIEGKVNFQSAEPYTPNVIRNVDKVPTAIDQGKTTTQVIPATAEDVYTHEKITLFGETTILTPFDNMKTTMEASLPNLGYVHEQLEKRVYPEGGRRNVGVGKGYIELTDDMTIDDIIPEETYIRNGKTISGKALWEKFNTLKK